MFINRTGRSSGSGVGLKSDGIQETGNQNKMSFLVQEMVVNYSVFCTLCSLNIRFYAETSDEEMYNSHFQN